MDFKEQLRKQLRFLQTSCDLYDAGDKDEAIRIATSLRNLFHSTKSMTSILAHLKILGIKMLCTGGDIRPGVKDWPNLTVIKLSPVLQLAEYAPKLDTAQINRFIALSRWWRDEIVYLVGGVVITRRDLVLAAADKDGGAHVDAKLDLYYEHLLNGAGGKMTLNLPSGSKEFPFKYGHLAALRQIGYETLQSPDITKLV